MKQILFLQQCSQKFFERRVSIAYPSIALPIIQTRISRYRDTVDNVLILSSISNVQFADVFVATHLFGRSRIIRGVLTDDPIGRRSDHFRRNRRLIVDWSA